MYRSMLYVPATNARFVAKASERGADAIILDLEDSIPDSEKSTARDALANAVPQCRATKTDVLVRINQPMRKCVRDIEAAVAAKADGVILPKAETAEHINCVSEILADAETEYDIDQQLKMLVILEDPNAVLNAQAIIGANDRVIGAATGGEDLATALGAEAIPEALRLPKLLVHMAAKAAGKYSFGLFASVADYSDKTLVADCVAEAKRHGFDGATCIHPSIVPLLNDGFRPSEIEIATAKRVIAALENAERDGVGAVSVDGRMIDKPIVDRARRLLARAAQCAAENG